jgi:DNA N-6-adenine-methyltransferase (Dam)
VAFKKPRTSATNDNIGAKPVKVNEQEKNKRSIMAVKKTRTLATDDNIGAKPVKVNEQEEHKDIILEESIQLGDYTVFIKGSKTEAVTEVFREEDTILSKGFTGTEITVSSYRKFLDAFSLAKLEAIAAYHEATGVAEGLVMRDSLVEHPLNSLIYGENENVDDLVALLEKEDGQIFELLVNPQGQVLAGNRRLKASKLVDEKRIAEGKPPKYEFLNIKTLKLPSREAELKYMTLHNTGRVKTKAQLAAEVRVLLELSNVSAIVDQHGVSGKDNIEQLKEILNTGRSTAFNVQKVFKALSEYQDPGLRSELESFAVEVPNKAKELVEKIPPKSLEGKIDKEEYQKKILDYVKQHPSESVKKATLAVDKTIAVGSGDQDIFEKALLLGDKASDNRKTPKEVLSLALDTMGLIDLDAFAMIDDREYVPAKLSYTIEDNAFLKDCKGSVFANPPFSRCSDAIAKLDAEICKGHTEKLFLILPVSVQSSSRYHNFLKSHNPLVFQPYKRLSFEPGKLLLREEPSATADGNREPSVILFWSNSDSDYGVFHDCAIGLGYVARQYTPLNPYQIAKAIASLEWHQEGDKWSCNVFGNHSVVFVEEDKLRVKVNNTTYSDLNTFANVDAAKSFAVIKAIEQLILG